MNLLMLRGQVPTDRNSSEIVFDKLEDVDDVWTMLFYSLIGNDDYGELWYWGGNRVKKFTNNFTERWLPTFQKQYVDFIPDIIFCRGGFQEYHWVLNRFPNAIKIYYGAGRRFLPQPGFNDYDIILQDSYEQVIECKKKFPKAMTTLFIKPAADNIFYPHTVEKEYDICFPANGSQKFKGHDFVYNTVPSNFKLLNLGNNPHNFNYPSNVTSYRVLKKDMAEHYSKCKIGIVVVSADIDSCPRVIPEMMACNLPVVVLNTVRFWQDRYINSVYSSSNSFASGELVKKKNFWSTIEVILSNLSIYEPRKYYEQKLSLSIAADFLRKKINEVSI